MEYCIEVRALKQSLRREIDVRSSYNQELAVRNMVSAADEADGGVVGGFVDDFLIDELLDFPEKETKVEEEKESLSDCSVELELDENCNSAVSGICLDLEIDDAGLAVPQDDLADLEWVSRFVDDSMSEFPPLYPSGKENTGVNYRRPTVTGSLPVKLKQQYTCNGIKPVIPAKPRTKRERVGRVWSVGSSTVAESSTTTSSSVISTPVQFGFSKPGSKRQKFEPKSKPGLLVKGNGDASKRKCSHCQVQKTPQWRAGPEGAKTLCNACGVRFKSGRLYPEYRPACSPTFKDDVHSNSHRKVLEMRKMKDMVGRICC